MAMILNKRGFLRLIEVMIAITILSVSILYVFVNKAPSDGSLDVYVYTYEKEILSHISINQTLRDAVVHGEVEHLYGVVAVPENLGYAFSICELARGDEPCNLDPTLRMNLENQGVYDIYVSETIIASDLDTYDPKKLKIFMWQKVRE